MPTLSTNRRAHHDYRILEEFEAGIVLTGPEVKSAKHGHVNLTGSYATVSGDGAWLINAHIAPYPPARNVQVAYDPTRTRKLLLTEKEISTLIGKQRSSGLTIVPLAAYTKGGFVKLKLGLARGKRREDRRDDIRKRETLRRIRSATSRFIRGR